jgi:hypothetical protein
MQKQTKHDGTWVPLALSAVAFGIFTYLLWLRHIGEASYCFLVALTAMLGLVLHGFSRLQEFDLKNLRLVLRKIEETKQDLFVREEKLKAIALPLAQIIAFTGSSEGRMGSAESWEAKRRWYRHKLQELVNNLDLSPAEIADVNKYLDKYAEIDRQLGKRGALKTTDPDYEQVKANLERISSELLQMMKIDVSE